MRFWWVNHRKTGHHEVQGGYLWSPKRKSNGNFNRYYENMRFAVADDAVLSYANGTINYAGIVSGRAFEEGKPKAFGAAGDGWSDDGWWLPVEWTRLDQPFAPRDCLSEIRPLLPANFSPLYHESGDGNRGAYLAEISPNLFSYVIEQSGTADWAARIRRDAETNLVGTVPESFRSTEDDQPLAASERQQLNKARRGQGLFRFRVFQIEDGCRLTGIRNPDLLIASHIKPWRLCTTTTERLDGANGLLLAPHVDRLFDQGLITFSDEGHVRTSKKLRKEDIQRLGLHEACRSNVGSFSAGQRFYLNCHRRHVFKQAKESKVASPNGCSTAT